MFLSLSGLLLLLHFLYGRAFYFLCDDAYITFRYARNFVLGRGLVWNPGEAVEGYTNFLWTLFMAAAIRLDISPETAAPVLSILCDLAVLALLLPAARRLAPAEARWTALIALGLLALNRSWNVWATGGLETRLFTLLTFAGLYCLLLAPLSGDGSGTTAAGSGRNRHTGRLTPLTWQLLGATLLGLGALTRPDGLLLFGMAMIALAVERRGELLAFGDWRRRVFPAVRELALTSLPFLVIVGGHLIFRLAYYGRPLPNTYYAKVDAPWPEMGFLYLFAFALEYGLVLWLPFGVALMSLARRRAGAPRFYLYFLLIFAPHALYYAYKVGGDHFEFRIFDIYLPLLALFLAHSLVLLWNETRRRWSGRRWAPLPAALVTLWLLGLYFFIPNWHFFLPGGTPFGHSGVPVEEPDKLARPYSFLPLLRGNFDRWKDAQLRLQHHQIAVRMEAHRDFWDWRTRQMRPFFEREMPPDAVTEDGGIGILGYFVDIVVIDRLGLTDRTVAENGSPLHEDPHKRMIAHNRRPPPGYLRERGFNLYVHCVVSDLVTDIATIAEECPEWRRTMSHLGDTYVARWRDFYFIYSSPPGWEATTAAWTRATFREWKTVRIPEKK